MFFIIQSRGLKQMEVSLGDVRWAPLTAIMGRAFSG